VHRNAAPQAGHQRDARFTNTKPDRKPTTNAGTTIR
jgi:hypothetical protein